MAGPDDLTLANILAASPFAAVFVTSSVLTVRHVYPRLSRAANDDARDGQDHVLPSHAPAGLRQMHAEHGAKSLRRRAVAWTFGATVGLATSLGMLILSEILEVFGRSGRTLALRFTVPALLLMLVVLVPWLECQSLVGAAGWTLGKNNKGRVPRFAWAMQMGLFAGWLFAFWKIGGAIPSVAGLANKSDTSKEGEGYTERLTKACLERIGVVGISLMALLAGFASVSSPWHTFGEVSERRRKPVTEADVTRKEAGLEATSEMLLTKRHRLQLLERMVADPQYAASKSSGGFVGKMMGSLRGASSEETEIKSLRVEIAGLETMEANLSSNLILMKGRRKAADRASTTLGRFCLVPSYVFSAYCVYRILATALTTIRRASSPNASFSNSDPINRFLGLLALHWNPKLDQQAWARVISFALSGVILLASANSAIQTFHLFAKWMPGLLRHAQANLALVVGQVAATYMISASLLLRSQLPSEARSAVGGVLRGALSPAFVDGWFEGWFLLGSLVTAIGLWIARKVSGDDDWDDYGSEEMGAKRM